MPVGARKDQAARRAAASRSAGEPASEASSGFADGAVARAKACLMKGTKYGASGSTTSAWIACMSAKDTGPAATLAFSSSVIRPARRPMS